MVIFFSMEIEGKAVGREGGGFGESGDGRDAAHILKGLTLGVSICCEDCWTDCGDAGEEEFALRLGGCRCVIQCAGVDLIHDGCALFIANKPVADAMGNEDFRPLGLAEEAELAFDKVESVSVGADLGVKVDDAGLGPRDSGNQLD